MSKWDMSMGLACGSKSISLHLEIWYLIGCDAWNTAQPFCPELKSITRCDFLLLCYLHATLPLPFRLERAGVHQSRHTHICRAVMLL